MSVEEKIPKADREGQHGFSIVQVAIMVHDLDATLRNYQELLGWGPWRMVDLSKMPQIDQEVRGRSQSFNVLAGLYRAGEIDLEVIEPSTPGSPQAEFVATGQGLHHIQVRGRNEKRLRQQLDGSGIPILLSGKIRFAEDADLEYRYYDKTDALHAYVEATFGNRERFLKHLGNPTDGREAAQDTEGSTSEQGAISQVSLIVDDLDRAIKSYQGIFGWGPWTIKDTVFQEQSGNSAITTATAAAGGVELKLIKPLASGHYRKVLDTKGEGLHHVRIAASNREKVRARLERLGIKPVGEEGQSVLYDTMSDLHLYVEA